MGLFNKPSSSFVSGGHSFVADVISNEGGNTGRGLIAWRDPREDFNTSSKLIVRQGEEAVFENGGSEYAVFPRGEYELKTQNKVFVRSFQEALTGGASSFPCRVYFVSIEEFRQVEWYTVTPIRYTCPLLGDATEMRGGGVYVIQVVDSMKFVSKMLRDNLSYDVNMLKEDLASLIYKRVAKIIATILKEQNIVSTDVANYLEDIADACKPKVQDLLEPYGIQLNDFTVELEVDAELFEDYNNRVRNQVLDAQGAARARMTDAQSKMQELQMMGSAYQTIKGMELLQDIANNPGAGGVAAAGAGLGVGMAAGSAFGNIAQSVFTQQPQMPPQPQQSGFGGSERFGVGGGQPQQAAQPDPMESLQKMKKMLDAGLITQQIYDAKVAEIMSRL